MAVLSKSGTPSLTTLEPPANCKLALIAGEDIAAGDACYIKSDGKWWRSNGTSANAAAQCDGFALSAATAGEALTCGWNIRINYGAGMTPGTPYYVSTTAGQLADAATTGGTAVVAVAADATRLEVRRSR